MRTRLIHSHYPSDILLGKKRYYDPNGKWLFTTTEYHVYPPSGTDRSQDQCVDETHPGPPYRTGGPLTVNHFTNVDIPICSGRHWVGGTNPCGYYEGSYWIPDGYLIGVSYVPSEMNNWDTSNISSLGATGWNKFQPGKPTADASVFLAELRELPALLKESVQLLKQLATSPNKAVRNMSLKNTGSRYLAYQFGWAPLVRDLQKFYRTAQNLDKSIARLRKYNGQWERRGGTLYSKGGSSYSSGGASFQPAPDYYSMPPEGLTYGYTLKEWGCKAWFTAMMKYYIPDFEGASTQSRLKRRLFGLEITPAAVWELVPWSWLVDWFSNVGDVIANMTPIDNLVAKYAYVMRHSWVTYTRVGKQRYAADPSKTTYFTASGSSIQKWERKERCGASPFGFGLSEGDLSSRQWAILAALGFQRFL